VLGFRWPAAECAPRDLASNFLVAMPVPAAAAPTLERATDHRGVGSLRRRAWTKLPENVIGNLPGQGAGNFNEDATL
jgi:hypothetical protein